MPIYVMLTTLTEKGMKTIKEKPERMKEVNKEVEAMGIKILTQYVLLGQYESVNIIKATNIEAIAKLTVELASRGALQTMTLPAMTLDDFIKGLKK